MSSYYNVYITDGNGTRLTDVPDYISLEYARATNTIGTAKLTIPITYLQYVGNENRIEIWRSVDSGPYYLETETVWFMKKIDISINQDGAYVLAITAFDDIHLLTRRIIAYPADQRQTTKTAPADNMMKAIIRENFGSLISGRDGTNQIGVNISSYLNVQGDYSAGYLLTKSFSHKNVLSVMQELAAASTANNLYLSFDIAYLGDNQFEFRTYSTQRGVDNRFPSGQNPLILDPSLGTLEGSLLEYDYTSAYNVIYTGGQGQGSARIIKDALDLGRVNASVLGRTEDFVDSNNTSDPVAVQAEADAALRLARPRLSFNSVIVETDTVKYGVHYNYGDQVTAQFVGLSFDCRIDMVHVTYDQNQTEKIEIKLQSVT